MFTDIHCHILPGVDDGPGEIEGSLAMAAQAVADGTGQIVATPHNMHWRPGAHRERMSALAAQVQQELDQRGLALRIVVGTEVYIAPDLPARLDDGRAYTINGSRYILVELPFTFWPDFSEDALSALQERGLVPILAHAERYTTLQRDPDRLRPLVEHGILVQLTAGSLLGGFGREAQRAAQVLLEHNLAHVIASDGHNTTYRVPVLSATLPLAGKIVGPEAAQTLVESVPAAIVANQPVAIAPPRPVLKQRSWLDL
ncbi:MAG: hypothetical protein IT330_12505 [Anaerolineae bacterium]|nr:hypothetical protein [Anaerolineae bacterium]